MAEKPTAKKLSDKNTKQEMLDAYQTLARQLEEKRANELNPERKSEERRSEEAVKVAQALAPEDVERQIGNLKSEIGKFLSGISEKLGQEVSRFQNLQKAVESRQKEIQELYGIEKNASTLAALIESQNEKKREFEEALEEQRNGLQADIESTRRDWEKEKKLHEIEIRDRDAVEKKARDQSREEFTYAFKREQQAIRDQLADEKAKLEKEIHDRREAFTREFADREKAISDRETELNQLRERAAVFPKELETAVAKAVQESTARLQSDAKNREELLKKEFDGQRNVLSTRIESLERMVKETTEQNAKLARQLETAYQKVQEIAEKAIEGSSQAKAFADLQKYLAEQSRKPSNEKVG